MRSKALKVSEIFNSVESGIVRVVIVLRAVYRGAAKEDYIISLYLKINVLESRSIGAFVSPVNNVGNRLKTLEIA